MIVRVHGSRGSHPTSVTPVRVKELQKSLWDLFQQSGAKSWTDFENFLEKQPRYMHQVYGGNTTCLELSSEHSPMPLFIDAGSGLTGACMDQDSCLRSSEMLSGKGEAAFLFTHTHWDHISGLVTIPQLFMENNQFHFYGVHKDLRGRVSGIFDPRYFPVPFSQIEPRMHFHQIAMGHSMRLGNLKIDHRAQSHPGGSFAYRISDAKHIFVMATDTDLRTVGDPLITGDNIYSNAHVLLLDAHFSPEDFINKEDYGHAHLHQAIDFGVKENAKLIYLFHQNPYYNDRQVQEQLDRAWDYVRKKHPQSRSEIRMAVDGDVLDLAKL